MTDPSSTASTADSQHLPEGRAPSWLIQPVLEIESASELDRPAALLDRVADGVLSSPRLEGILRGDRFGHAVHPLLTDFPLGSFLSATLLDLFGGRRSRPAATGLIAFGLAMTLPTAASGLAEWRAAGTGSRRVGVVHAAVNTTAASCYLASLVARLRGRHRKGVLLAVAGGAAAWVGGYLGGHLSLVRKIGTSDPSYGPEPGPPSASYS